MIVSVATIIDVKAADRKGCELGYSVTLVLDTMADMTVNAASRHVRLRNFRADRKVCCSVVNAKRLFTAGHSARVAAISDRVAERLGLPPPQRRWLRRGVLLNDLGKLGNSNTVIEKPGKFNAQGWKAIQQHPVYSEHILARVPPIAELARIVGAHHEHLDGCGYPRGLDGAQIPLEIRIITVTDIFDAITSHRPSHRATSLEQTLDIMRGMGGTSPERKCFQSLGTEADK